MVFWLFILLIGSQRVIELLIARRNEKWVIEQGGYEVGQEHYKYIVIMHLLFFASLIYEGTFFGKGLSNFYPLLLVLFFLTQIGRVWAILSLGRFWNTKIMILPTSQIQVKGPYKYIKHPNYFIVTLELVIIPLLFEAYFTAFIFSILNIVVLSIRIPTEEKALRIHTEYQHCGNNRNGFLFGVIKTLKKD